VGDWHWVAPRLGCDAPLPIEAGALGSKRPTLLRPPAPSHGAACFQTELDRLKEETRTAEEGLETAPREVQAALADDSLRYEARIEAIQGETRRQTRLLEEAAERIKASLGKRPIPMPQPQPATPCLNTGEMV